MHFSDEQIGLAIQLKNAGLRWCPQCGQYAMDFLGRIPTGSPFQQNVYYFHNFRCFIDHFGSLAKLKESMVWLPTFEEAMNAIKTPIDFSEFSSYFDSGTELDFLYRQWLTEIKQRR